MKTSILRLVTLYEYIIKYEKTRVITLKSFQDYLYKAMDEYTCDEKTIRRDLKQMRDELGINVQYIRGRYQIVPFEDEEVSRDVERFLSFSQLVNKVSDLHKQALSKLRSINLEAASSFDSHWATVAQILPHIWHKQVINICHRTYDHDTSLRYRVEPLYIIERMQRWYLVAHYKNRLQTFGLDRIDLVEGSDQNFVLPKDFSIQDKLYRLIGVDGINQNPEKLTVRFPNHQSKYDLPYPWHPDYVISYPKENHTDFTYNVVLNYAMKRKILSYGKDIEVIEPEHFRKEIIDQLNAAKEIYK